MNCRSVFHFLVTSKEEFTFFTFLKIVLAVIWMIANSNKNLKAWGLNKWCSVKKGHLQQQREAYLVSDDSNNEVPESSIKKKGRVKNEGMDNIQFGAYSFILSHSFHSNLS